MYEGSIICVVFDEKHNFEDILHIGVSHSLTESFALIMEDIYRVMENFGSDKCTVETGRSVYDEPITVVDTVGEDGLKIYWHYYCLQTKKEEGNEERK